jgi:hypothetical protein
MATLFCFFPPHFLANNKLLRRAALNVESLYSLIAVYNLGFSQGPKTMENRGRSNRVRFFLQNSLRTHASFSWQPPGKHTTEGCIPRVLDIERRYLWSLSAHLVVVPKKQPRHGGKMLPLVIANFVRTMCKSGAMLPQRWNLVFSVLSFESLRRPLKNTQISKLSHVATFYTGRNSYRSWGSANIWLSRNENPENLNVANSRYPRRFQIETS